MYFDYEGPNGFTMTTRVLGGSIPGPTFEVSAGDTMNINFRNKLKNQSGVVHDMNMLRSPDTTNLHWHGAHVSPKEP
jgi:FtsP/CotA-like multicopper oxidase with cupredoxin domain